MEKIFIDTPVAVITITAASFPEGVGAAHEQIRRLIKDIDHRRIFGISHGSPGGGIVYKAAAEKQQTSVVKDAVAEEFIIPAGWYNTETILNWRKDESSVGKTFSRLLQHPELDPEGFCLEEYPNEKDVVCMVKLKPGD